jgi:protein transport protein SEC24
MNNQNQQFRPPMMANGQNSPYQQGMPYGNQVPQPQRMQSTPIQGQQQQFMQNRPPNFQSPIPNQQRSMSTPPQPMTPQPMTSQPPMTPQPMGTQPPLGQMQQPQPLQNQLFRPQNNPMQAQQQSFSRSGTPQMSRPPYQMTSGQFSPQLSSRSPSPGFPPPPTDKQMPQSPNIGNASPITGRHRQKYPEQMGKAYSNGPESLPNMNQGMQTPQQPQFFVPGNMGQQNMMQRDLQSPVPGFQSPMNSLSNSFSNMNLNSQKNVTSVSLFNAPPNVQTIDNCPEPVIPAQFCMQSEKKNPPYGYCCSTLNAVPQNNALLQKSKIPFGLVLSPYKNIGPDEAEVPVVSPEVIVRCKICRAYINPFVTFVDQGTRWKCNICHVVNDLPAFYSWDSKTRQAIDRSTIPELNSAVVEFVATKEYTHRPPQPVVIMLVIDVSFQSIQSGMVATAARTILSSLDSIPNYDNRTKIGFITYDSTLHFYNLNSSLTEPQMLVVSDIDDIFIPAPDDLLVNLSESRAVIENFLNKLGNMHKNTQNVSSALPAALTAANKVIGSIGGKIAVFQSNLPNCGKNSLKKREDPTLYNTSKESTLLQPADHWYKDFALDCSKKQICVDAFIFSGQYTDVATISALPRFTGGSVYFYPGFDASRVEDATKFSSELNRFLSKKHGFEAVLRMRSTRGVSIKGFYGNFFLMATDLVQLPNVNPDNCYALEASIEKDLTSEQFISFQSAILHTSNNGERRIRVVTNVIPVTNSLTEVFANADPRAIAVLTAKKAVERTISDKLEDARNLIISTCVDIMGAYKQAFTSSGQASQLLIIENLALLPVLVQALLKNIAFRRGNIPSDIRSFALSVLYGSPIENSLAYIYSKLYAIHILDANTGLPIPNTSQVYMPPRINLSMQRMTQDGIYLLDNSQHIIIWLSRGSNPELVNALFQKPYEAIQSGKTTLPTPNNDYATRINNIIECIRKSRLISYNNMPYVYVVKEDDNNRGWFISHMVEDKLDSELSYPQFLSHLREQLSKYSS